MRPGDRLCPDCGKNIKAGHRYPLGPLAELLRMSVSAVAHGANVSGTTFKDARCHGMSQVVAERVAVAHGVPPYVVWPEMLDHNIEASSAECVECGESFVPSRKSHVYCSDKCRHRKHSRERMRRKYQTDPVFREERKAANRRHYRETAEYRKAYQRRHYWETGFGERRKERYWSDPEYRQRRIEQQRAYRARKREEAA